MKLALLFSAGSALVTGCALASKVYFGPPIYQNKDDLPADHVIVLTGATEGIGKELAFKLAQRHPAHLILASRNMAACKERKRKIESKLREIDRSKLSSFSSSSSSVRSSPNRTTTQIQCAELDLSSLRSVEAFATNFRAKHSKLDTLVHNAAFMLPPLKTNQKQKHAADREAQQRLRVSADSFETQLAVNCLARHRLTKLMLPNLRASNSHLKRIVHIVCPSFYEYKQQTSAKQNEDDATVLKKFFSEISSPNLASNENAFQMSQLANALVTAHWAKVLHHESNDNNTNNKNNKSIEVVQAAKSIPVICADPGASNTRFNRHLRYNAYFISRKLFAVLNAILLQDAWRAAETPLMACCCKTNELLNESPPLDNTKNISASPLVILKNLKPIDSACFSSFSAIQQEQQKMFTIADFWTDLNNRPVNKIADPSIVH